LFFCSNAHEIGLDVEHIVLHEGKDADSLAIEGQSIAGDNVRISPQTAGGSSAHSECFAKATDSVDVERSILSSQGTRSQRRRGEEE